MISTSTNVRLISLILLFMVVATLLGCRNASVNEGSQNPVRESEIIDFVFEDISVSVGVTVVWTNMDNKAHTTTSGVPPDVSGFWDSPFLKQSQTFSYRFTEVGEFEYWCRVHPFMTATVKVEN